MREIDPKKVPDMMLSGELRFGMELEFSDDNFYKDTHRMAFDGFNKDSQEFLCHHKTERTPRLFRFARFPLPKLRDGDPVVIVYAKSTFHAIFRKFDGNEVVVYYDGGHPWTYIHDFFSNYQYNEWRLPTKQELEGILSPDQITDLESRGCVG